MLWLNISRRAWCISSGLKSSGATRPHNLKAFLTATVSTLSHHLITQLVINSVLGIFTFPLNVLFVSFVSDSFWYSSVRSLKNCWNERFRATSRGYRSPVKRGGIIAKWTFLRKYSSLCSRENWTWTPYESKITRTFLSNNSRHSFTDSSMVAFNIVEFHIPVLLKLVRHWGWCFGIFFSLEKRACFKRIFPLPQMKGVNVNLLWLVELLRIRISWVPFAAIVVDLSVSKYRETWSILMICDDLMLNCEQSLWTLSLKDIAVSLKFVGNECEVVCRRETNPNRRLNR